MKSRSELRQIIINVLYQIYIFNDAQISYETMDLIKDQLELENDFLNTNILGIIEKQTIIDKLANKYLQNWDINRLNKVDKAIISLGIYELMTKEVPSIVAINEAIELSKKYSDVKVTKMINGVLDNIYHNEVNYE
ncbi:MAG: transcription antitermination factor NusB [Tenericutes bacterium]|nr:transcription antitermination factor NusB [Mycoplasmatota bacterium]